MKKIINSSLTRRRFLTGVGATLTAPAILKYSRAYADNPILKVGFVSPQTGPLAGFDGPIGRLW